MSLGIGLGLIFNSFVDTGIGIDPATLASNTLALDTYNEDYLSIKTAAQFTAANSEYLSSASTDFDFGDTDWSISTWFYPDTSVSNMYLVSKWGTGAQNGYFIRLDANNKARVSVSDAGNNSISLTSTDTISDNTWGLITVSYDSTLDILSLIVDGGTPVTISHSGGIFASSDPFILGALSSLVGFTNGRQDSVSVYNTALTQAQVTTLYNGGNGLNYSEWIAAGFGTNGVSYWALNETSGTRYDLHGGNHLTDNNTVTYNQGLVRDKGFDEYVTGKAADFNAANLETLSSNDSAFAFGNEDFSVAGWFYADVLSSAPCIGKWDESTNDRSYLITNRSSGTYRAYLSEDGTTIARTLNSTVTATTGAWHFFVYTYNSSEDLVKFSVDNETYVTGASTVGPYVSAAEVVLGKFDGGGNYFDGRMDGFLFYNKSLTESEKSALYASGVGVNYEQMDKTSLLAYWNMNEASGDRLDSTANGLNLTDNNTVTQATGILLDEIQTVYDISYWQDRSGEDNHFEQSAILQRPFWNGASIDFDGVDEFLACINGATPFASDTEGEIIVVGNKTAANRSAAYFNVVQEGSSVNPFNLAHLRQSDDNRLFFRSGGTENNQIRYDLNDPINVPIIYHAKGDASTWEFGVNNIFLPENLAGTEGGWVDSVAATADSTYLMKAGNAVFSQGAIQAVYYFNQKLTTAQRDGVMAWINNEYNVYTPITALADLGAKLKFYGKYDMSNIDRLSMTPEIINSPAEYDNGETGGIIDGISRNVTSTLYESDFSSGGSGWTNNTTNLIVTIGESIGGVDDCMKLTLTGGAANHGTRKAPTQPTLKTGNVKIGIYIPITNTIISGLRLGVASSIVAGRSFVNLTKGEWHYFDYDQVYGNTISSGILNTIDDNSSSSASADGESVYVSYIRTYILDTKSMLGTSGSGFPRLDTAVESLDFDGISDLMTNPDLFTEIASDTQGEMIVVFDDDEGVGVANNIFGMDDGTGDNIATIQLSTTNNLTLRYKIAGSSSNRSFGVITRGGEVEMSIASNSSSYRGFNGFVELGGSGGTGNWFAANVNLTRIGIANLQANFYAFGLKRLIYLSEQLSYDSRRQFKKFRDAGN